MKGLTTKGGTPRIALCPPRQRRGGGDLKGGVQGGNAPAERVAPRRFCIFKARMLILANLYYHSVRSESDRSGSVVQICHL